ncbi:esterase/lipase family protein [Simkania sp.]|uniref:esterase/lipase family protein n=1 Tax=Simkania sp. TaxID=34094 RepID=UPI003B52DE40
MSALMTSISNISTPVKAFLNLEYSLAASSLSLGIALPIILSCPMMGYFSDSHKHYSWQPFTSDEKQAPGLFDDPQKVETGAPLIDRRNPLLLIFHRYVAFLSDVYTQIITKYEAFLDWKGSPSQTYIDPSLTQSYRWKEKSTGLYVFIHGIHGHPSCWNAYKKAIEAHDPNADVCLIKVNNGGDCSLEEATTPILNLLKNYTTKYRDKPIALVGTSRGGPIVASLELKMRKLAQKPKVYVGTIAGAHHGSLMMTLLKMTGCAHLWFSPEVIEELSYKSDCSKELLEQQQKKLTTKRKFRSYCTTEEFQIQPCISAFSRLVIETSSKSIAKERFYVHGSGHLSIVDRVQTHLLNDLFEWMKN